ncbi:MAG: ROK family protein [Rhodospirillales bacterium]|nr:ROK family protein [Rhodospirillales bacterium]
MDILVIDVGGASIKMRTSASPEIRQIPSGRALTPAQMIERTLAVVSDWRFDAVSLGYPGVVRDGRPSLEPHNLGPGWVGFDYQRSFCRPLRIVNDAAMQAIGSYQGGRMLFLGLGTGLGSALLVHGTVHGLEISQLPYKAGHTFGGFLAQRGLERLGLAAWREEVANVVSLLRDALVTDYVILGGGNVRHLDAVPPFCRPGHNANAFEGGFRLWKDPEIRL